MGENNYARTWTPSAQGAFPPDRRGIKLAGERPLPGQAARKEKEALIASKAYTIRTSWSSFTKYSLGLDSQDQACAATCCRAAISIGSFSGGIFLMPHAHTCPPPPYSTASSRTDTEAERSEAA